MTLQSSGQIRLTQIAAEYSDAKPHKLTEFYGKPGLPSSGRIDFTDFYGKSAFVGYTLIAANGGDSKYSYSGWAPGVVSGGSVSPSTLDGKTITGMYIFCNDGQAYGQFIISFSGVHSSLGITGVTLDGVYIAMTHNPNDGNSFWLATNVFNTPTFATGSSHTVIIHQ